MPKTPEQIAREAIDRRLNDAGWVIQDMNKINLSVALGMWYLTLLKIFKLFLSIFILSL